MTKKETKDPFSDMKPSDSEMFRKEAAIQTTSMQYAYFVSRRGGERRVQWGRRRRRVKSRGNNRATLLFKEV